MSIENPAQQPIAAVPRAYVYAQYSDDANVTAFFTAYTQIAQGYLQWFQNNCLGFYIGQSGALLDWIGANLYGLPRPVLGTLTRVQTAAIGTMPVNTQAINANWVLESGNAEPVSDDIYQRYLTMWLYLGDGKQMSIEWIRRRVARFLFGAGGSGIPAQDLQKVGVSAPLVASIGAIGTVPINTQTINVLPSQTQVAKGILNINVPLGGVSGVFQSLFNAGLVPLPFQIKFTVTIGIMGN